MEKEAIEEGKDKIIKEKSLINGIDPVEYYIMLQGIMDIFGRGRRVNSAIMIWYGEENDKKEKDI